MRGRAAITVMLMVSAGSAWAQTRPAAPVTTTTTRPLGAAAQVQPAVDPLAPRAATPAPAVTPAPAGTTTTVAEPLAPLPVPEVPPAIWSAAPAAELLGFVRAIGSEGLDPRDYSPALLEAALKTGDPAQISAAANTVWPLVVRDLALGHVRGAARVQWFVRDPDLPEGRTRQLLDAALAGGSVTATLNGLLPNHPQYGSLKNALAKADAKDAGTVGAIRLNMDRWRWLPRDLGNRYIIVNVPGEHATLVENSVTRWKHRAIAGAPKTPTPQLSVMATGVHLNPWWEVPKSLSASVAGKAGYVAVKGKDGKVQRWRQPPGPSNALGKIKFTMANEHAIFLHDTNNRGLFDSQNRFFSHGCIRTENVLDLAAELLSDDGGDWDRAKIDAALDSKKTVMPSFVKPVPVYIVYFSVAALTDGSIVKYTDLYKRDAPVRAALNDRDGGAKPPVRSASR
ncbi:murein L,D-transpeptidase YcbB/YkuD [Sphingomonas kaistensis]|uniref:Murein L,D-transpeptidase YcbB/YkuD n=1 Tax=Sphingomonas kaistensis TaxID=298708 RepID=A0A7X6BFP7_9SPHN|nr:L,D-transpeptidase family protein [Sphingomonas kaistensis]NJC04685.1 murein L,D-transpeptidase YcbB/YkuD [Sphingomonas kaistensis]